VVFVLAKPLGSISFGMIARKQNISLLSLYLRSRLKKGDFCASEKVKKSGKAERLCPLVVVNDTNGQYM